MSYEKQSFSVGIFCAKTFKINTSICALTSRLRVQTNANTACDCRATWSISQGDPTRVTRRCRPGATMISCFLSHRPGHTYTPRSIRSRDLQLSRAGQRRPLQIFYGPHKDRCLLSFERTCSPSFIDDQPSSHFLDLNLVVFGVLRYIHTGIDRSQPIKMLYTCQTTAESRTALDQEPTRNCKRVFLRIQRIFVTAVDMTTVVVYSTMYHIICGTVHRARQQSPSCTMKLPSRVEPTY